MTQVSRILPRIATLGVVAALTLAACGGDDDSDSAESASTTESAGAPLTTEPEPTTPTANTTPASTSAEPVTTEPGDSTVPGERGPVVLEHAYGTTEIAARPERVVSASVSMTGTLLAIGAPVVASMATQPGPVANSNGFFLQWATVAAERGVEPIPGPELNIEAIAAARPDLIVANAVGGQDAVTEELYALLSEIAPTVALDATGTTMSELATTLGQATWLDDDAAEAVAEVESHLAELAATIDTSKPVALFTRGSDGLNVFTATSPQGGVVEALGLTLTEVEAPTLSGEGGAGQRVDVVQVSAELLDQLGDSTLFVVLADQAAVDAAVAEMPTLAALPGVAEGRIFPLGNDVFRIDPFSAVLLADKLAAALQ